MRDTKMKRTRLLATLIVSIATASVMWSGQMGLSTTQTSAAVNHLQGASFMAVSGAARRESGSRGIFATKNEQAKPGNAPAKRSSSPLEPVNFQLDDNSAEDSIGWNYVNSDRSSAAIWLNRFTPTTPYYPITLENISILWPGSGAGPLLGREIRLLVYVDVDANNDPSNAVLVYQSVQTIQIANWVEWQTYSVNVPISLPGDIYIGFESKYGETAPSPRTYPAALDTTTTQARSWIAAKNTGDVPDINNLGQNDTLDLIDYFGYAGNWMVRASGHDALVFTPTPTVTPTPLPPRCPGERFTDVCPGDYFYTPVLSLNDAGVISGYNTSPPCESSAHIP